MNNIVGIEDINLYGSRLSVSAKELAAFRNLSEKGLKDVGFTKKTIVPLFEDPVTLAVNAAKPLLDAIDKNTIGLLIVATESGLDYGKPISSYVHRYLDLNTHCRNFEIKHACYGGTAALQMALNWLRLESPDKKALVISSDVARPHIGHLAELTAGSGASALLLSHQPNACIIGPVTGYASREVYDVARPTLKYEHGNPVLSLYSYLDLLELAWEDYAKKASISPQNFKEQFDYILFHTPLISLVDKAFSTLLKNIYEDIENEEIKTSFHQMVYPSFLYNYELANIYSGSLYTALAGLLEVVHEEKGRMKKVGFFSYGSGACAEFFSGEVNPAFTSKVHKKIKEHLETRRVITPEEYEKLVYDYEDILHLRDYMTDLNNSYYKDLYQNSNLLVLESIADYYRNYKWS